MKVRALTEQDLTRYDVLAREHGTLFNRVSWLSLFRGAVRIFGVFEPNDRLVGGFSVYGTRRWGVKMLVTPPFTPTCGPFFEIQAQHPVAVLEARRRALEAVAAFLDSQRRFVTSIAIDQRITDMLPFAWRNFKAIPRYTYLLNLHVSLEELRKNMSTGRRNDICKAVRDGLLVRPITDMSVVYDLVMSTFRRQAKFVDERLLRVILFEYATPSNSFALGTYKGRSPVAACFIVHDVRTAYYLLGGYNAELRHHGGGALALYDAVARAREIGLQTFDFEGSMVPSIERYFRGFGGELTSYFTVNKAWLPLEMALKVFRRQLF